MNPAEVSVWHPPGWTPEAVHLERVARSAASYLEVYRLTRPGLSVDQVRLLAARSASRIHRPPIFWSAR